jgi:UDP-glucose 4-epimerase
VILITGGVGYIGSHTLVELLLAGHSCIVIDNLCNSSTEALTRVKKITGKSVIFIECDIRDPAVLDRVFEKYKISSVIHFAGLKAVGESLLQPLAYYDNNVVGTVSLCKAMAAAGVFKMVFSSSATVYGSPIEVPVSEEMHIGVAANPYGRSKQMIEQILTDLALADERWSVALLRYFNPVGAHPSGLIGEDPNGIPNNLVPYIAQVAVGNLSELSVYGNDYPTPDGTGVRDYVHVVDLAEGHLYALHALQTRTGAHVWNLGTGQGYSVLQMVRAYEEASGRHVPFRIAPRRVGDIATCFADPSKVERELGWKAKRGLAEMMRDAWHWQSKNPYGYHTPILPQVR